MLLFAATAIAQCTADETLTGYAPQNTVFALREIDGAPYAAVATLTLPERGMIAGQAPCNAYSTAITVPYPWFRVEAIAATKRACPSLAAETVFFDALAQMTLAEWSGDILVLSSETGREMVFEAQE